MTPLIYVLNASVAVKLHLAEPLSSEAHALFAYLADPATVFFALTSLIPNQMIRTNADRAIYTEARRNASMEDIFLKIVLPSLSLILAALGGYLTIRTYLRTAQTRRAEWLFSLFSKFYEDEKSLYREIRFILDYAPKDQLEALCQSLKDDGNHELSEKLVNYLNFFEFVASLWKLGQLSLQEIHFLFDYYLRLIDRHPDVVSFVKVHGFENLEQLMARTKEFGNHDAAK